MFEYLLKNDKVPVEFITAQLDYANTASDRDFLPLLETAIQKASAVNPSVNEAFAEATARLPSRIFVHVLADWQRACVGALIDEMKDSDRAGLTVPSTLTAQWAGDSNELRYFKPGDRKRAEGVAELFQTVGLTLTLKDLSTTWSGARDSRPNTFEIWLGKGPLPGACGAPPPVG
jgi:hypothetical protein